MKFKAPIENNKLLKTAYFVGSQWMNKTENTSENTFKIEDPFDGEVISSLPYCGEKETQNAIEYAGSAKLRRWWNQ